MNFVGNLEARYRLREPILWCYKLKGEKRRPIRKKKRVLLLYFGLLKYFPLFYLDDLFGHQPGKIGGKEIRLEEMNLIKSLRV